MAPTNSPLPSTVQEITAACPQFRVLVLGKSGCGKSSLINLVFKVDKAQVSHGKPGEADINHEYRPKDNARFILHDSRGFEPGETANFNTVKDFVENRRREPQLKDRLHAIWVCISTPLPGDRITESGVEAILKMDHRDVPLIVVFTMYDRLVTSVMKNPDDPTIENDTNRLWAYGRVEAQKRFDELRKSFPDCPVEKVSNKSQHSDTIEHLIKTTGEEIRQRIASLSAEPTNIEPTSLAFSIAQRGNPEMKIRDSINVGRKRYWRGLLSSIDFEGRKLKECLDVVHGDIVNVWNLLDQNNYLEGEDFKAKISLIVEDLVPTPKKSGSVGLKLGSILGAVVAAPNPIGIALASVGVAAVCAKWVYDVYKYTEKNIASVMGYIVDLTIVMNTLFALDQVSKKEVSTVLDNYVKSGKRDKVHSEIRQFVADTSNIRFVQGKDRVLDEIVRLIEIHTSD